MMTATKRIATVTRLPLALTILAVCVSNANSAELGDVLGAWKIRIDGGGEIYTAHVHFVDQQGKLSGRYENEGRRNKVESAKVEKDVLTFVVKTQRFSTPVTATFTCDLAGDEMTGEVDFDSGARSRSYTFSGKRIGRSTTSEAKRPPITRESVVFRQGAQGYDQAVDAEIWQIAPSKSLLRQGTMTTDGNNGGGESQVLMKFAGIFGAGKRQIPQDARIVSAKLTVVAFDPGTTCHVHRLLVPWTPAVTWDGMAAGISIDNVEASTVRDGFTFGEINMDKQQVSFNVTDTVQHWARGEKNFGWVFVNTGSNGWDFYSSDWIDAEFRPMLEVTFERMSK